MKTYVGSKIIQAEPMSEKENFLLLPIAIDVKRGEWPDDRPNRPGYRVVYPDGYRSWSPKETFEIAYREVTQEEKNLCSCIQILKE